MPKSFCKNCNSKNRRIQANGYCSKCYRYVRLIELSKKWDINQPSTLKGYPNSSFLRNPRFFHKIKERVPRQWQNRLDWLRTRGIILENNIEGINLEYAFTRIADLVGVSNKNLFFGLASYFNSRFPPDDRKEIYRLLDKIEQSVPLKGINWGDVFND
ncbi:MAG: hypothetical protein V1799_06300 [bacterium]